MLLVTTIRIVNGYRILAAVSCCAPTYWWRLYWNGAPLVQPVQSCWLANVMYFDLKEPLAPGVYELGVAYGEWTSADPSPDLTVTLLVIRPDRGQPKVEQ